MTRWEWQKARLSKLARNTMEWLLVALAVSIVTGPMLLLVIFIMNYEFS